MICDPMTRLLPQGLSVRDDDDGRCEGEGKRLCPLRVCVSFPGSVPGIRETRYKKGEAARRRRAVAACVTRNMCVVFILRMFACPTCRI